MEYTFKAQDKSNSKRFLVKTCKIDETLLDQYMTQVMDKWGTYLDAAGKPVPHATVEGKPAEETKSLIIAALDKIVVETMAPEVEEAPAPSADAFTNFAFGQLTAPSNNAASFEQQAGRTTRDTVNNGLKIEKNRPTQNGITRPSAGTTCLAVWELAASMTAELGKTIPLSALIEAAKAKGINQYTARTQYACWRKFNGIVGHLAK